MKNQIKKEKDLFKKDLSNIKGSYTKALLDNIEKVNELGNNMNVDLNNYVKGILSIIETANDTNAKRNFILTLSRQRNKYNAMMYVSNAYLKGCGMEAI